MRRRQGKVRRPAPLLELVVNHLRFRAGEHMTVTILIIDDELHIRRLIAQMLELAGYRVLEAASGPEALSLLEEERPDVITCDIFMPGMSGFEVLEALKSQPSTAEIPVIMLTALGQEKDTARAMELGAADYVTKPFGTTKLAETIERQLDGRQEEDA
jgi:two-component system sensor histidine kinase ChiS